MVARRLILLSCFLLACLLGQQPAQAEVTGVADHGFQVVHERVVKATPESTYEAVFRVQEWWDANHTYSGSRENLSMDKQAGGIFLERLPNGGAVEHMRITAMMSPRMVVFRGALGPLAFDGLAGVLVMQIAPGEPKSESTLRWKYSVGGYRDGGFAEMATAVDSVLGVQIDALVSFAEGQSAIDESASEESEKGPATKPLPEVPVAGLNSLTPNTRTLSGSDASVDTSDQEIDTFEFIVGRWKCEALGGMCEESWSPPFAGQMQGSFQYAAGDSVKFRELFSLQKLKGQWVLRLKHFDADLAAWEEKDEFVDFALLACSEDCAWFDGLTMHRTSPRTLIVYVAMRSSDESVDEVVFPFELTE